MERGLHAPLSPNEELTLRRLYYGLLMPRQIPADHLRRFKSLALVEESGSRVQLTVLGRQRLEPLIRPSRAAD